MTQPNECELGYLNKPNRVEVEDASGLELLEEGGLGR